MRPSPGRRPYRQMLASCIHRVLSSTAILWIVLAMSACTDSTKVAAPPDKQVSTTSRMEIGSMSPEERALIERAVMTLPAVHREEARAAFMNESLHPSSTDPQLGPLLEQLAALRAAKYKPIHDAYAQIEAENKLRQVPVVVALVPHLGEHDVRAKVLRRPGDRGRPLVLLREGDFTEYDLQIGLQAAVRAADRYGADPQSEHRTAVRSGAPAASAQQPTLTLLVDMLRAAEPRNLAGFGTPRLMHLFVNRPSPSRRRRP